MKQEIDEWKTMSATRHRCTRSASADSTDVTSDGGVYHNAVSTPRVLATPRIRTRSAGYEGEMACESAQRPSKAAQRNYARRQKRREVGMQQNRDQRGHEEQQRQVSVRRDEEQAMISKQLKRLRKALRSVEELAAASQSCTLSPEQTAKIKRSQPCLWQFNKIIVTLWRAQVATLWWLVRQLWRHDSPRSHVRTRSTTQWRML